LDEAIAVGGMNRIMLDNFTPTDLKKAIQVIDKRLKPKRRAELRKRQFVRMQKVVWILFRLVH